MAKDGVGLNRWNTIFRTACQLEAEVFNTGLQAPTPYQIVPNGTYSVQSTSAAGRVVLANQNVERFLVVGVNKKGGNNEKVIRDALVFACPQTNPLYSGMLS